MEDVLVIIHAEDIPVAERLVASLPSYRVYTFDPVLVDLIAMSKLKNMQFIPWQDGLPYADLERRAREAARQVEQVLDAALRQVAPGLAMQSWQYLQLHFLFIIVWWYAALWDRVVGTLAGTKVHVFLYERPADLYFNSFLPALLLMQCLSRHAIAFAAYPYGDEPEPNERVPDLRGRHLADNNETLLAHLPTCFYDIYYFNQEMQASGKQFLNLAARKFDMPVFAQRSLGLIALDEVREQLGEERWRQAELFAETAALHLDKLLEPFIGTAAYRSRQVHWLAGNYKAQWVTYQLLQSYFAQTQPAKMLLSDHDMGLHGPLIAFARERQIPVVLLPHSKTSYECPYDYEQLVALTHPIQGAPIYGPSGKRVMSHLLDYPETLQAQTAVGGPLQRVGLLLNALSYDGIYCTNYDVYFDGIRRIIQWSKDRNISLRIRCKPSYSVVGLLALMGVDADPLIRDYTMPLQEFAASCDICLMYGAPTSGAIDFLTTGAPLLNPAPIRLTGWEASMMDVAIVAREEIEDCLARLDSFCADPVNLHAFKREQFIAYVSAFAGARPLRCFL